MCGFYFAANAQMVVDFSIKRDHKAITARSHGLLSRGREIEYGKPLMAKRHTTFSVGPHPLIVWPAVRQRERHASTQLIWLLSAAIDESGDSAHAALSARRARVDVLIAAGPQDAQARVLEAEHAAPLKSQ